MYMMCLRSPQISSCFLLFLPTVVFSFVPPPGEGDYQHLYPSICIGIKINGNEHVLSYFMGLIEDLRYPKNRMQIMFFAVKESQISSWLFSFPSGYYRLLLHNTDFDNWREETLVFGRNRSCDYSLLMDTDCLLLRDSLRQLISLNKLVVSPLLISPFNDGPSNVHGLLGEEFVHRKKDELIRVYYSKGPVLVDLKQMDSSYLTYNLDNLVNYEGTGDPIDVFAHSAFVMDIPIVFSNIHHYGYFIDSNAFTKAEHMALFGAFLAGWVSNVGPMPFPVSYSLKPWYPTPIKFGFDKVYLINLNRRPERLSKMSEVLRLVGMDFVRFEAVDGQNLTSQQRSSLHFLSGYEDPYYKRPMKLGEIGCFLSHLRVWEDVLQNGHERVIVLEDDVRFTENGTLILKLLVEDLMKTHLEWDFIYLGRKRMAPASEESFVPGHRYLSTVGYSYWTLGYAISARGVRKLLAARPLDRLLALDEFLPIMYDRHPNFRWSAQFEPRDLRAFAAFPSVVEPERYTNQPGYVSDTEGSDIIGKAEHNDQSSAENVALLSANVKEEL